MQIKSLGTFNRLENIKTLQTKFKSLHQFFSLESQSQIFWSKNPSFGVYPPVFPYRPPSRSGSNYVWKFSKAFLDIHEVDVPVPSLVWTQTCPIPHQSYDILWIYFKLNIKVLQIHPDLRESNITAGDMWPWRRPVKMFPFLSTPDEQSAERSHQSNWDTWHPLPSAPLNRCVRRGTSVASPIQRDTMEGSPRGRARGGRHGGRVAELMKPTFVCILFSGRAL